MEVRHECPRPGDEVDDLVGKQVWFDRRYTIAADAVDLVEFADKVEEVIVATFAEFAYIDSRYHDFLAALVSDCLGLIDNLADCP